MNEVEREQRRAEKARLFGERYATKPQTFFSTAYGQGRNRAMTPEPSPPRQDTRRTSAEKLERLREMANDMARAAAREKGEGWEQLAVWSTRIHVVLDGEF